MEPNHPCTLPSSSLFLRLTSPSSALSSTPQPQRFSHTTYAHACMPARTGSVSEQGRSPVGFWWTLERPNNRIISNRTNRLRMNEFNQIESVDFWCSTRLASLGITWFTLAPYVQHMRVTQHRPHRMENHSTEDINSIQRTPYAQHGTHTHTQVPCTYPPTRYLTLPSKSHRPSLSAWSRRDAMVNRSAISMPFTSEW